jgi:hypothetical protein
MSAIIGSSYFRDITSCILNRQVPPVARTPPIHKIEHTDQKVTLYAYIRVEFGSNLAGTRIILHEVLSWFSLASPRKFRHSVSIKP